MPRQCDLARSLLITLLALPTSVLYAVLLDPILGGATVALLMLAAAFLFRLGGLHGGPRGGSNSPVWKVMIATALIAALALYLFFGAEQAGPASAIIVGAVVCCAAAIGGHNMPNLKAGGILGASQGARQPVQMPGVIAALCVLSPVFSLLAYT